MKKIVLKGYFNTFLLLVLSFCILLFLYSIQRIGFYVYNNNLFPQVDASSLSYMLWGGVKFDVVAILYFNILFILLESLPIPFKYNLIYQKVCKWLFVVTNSIAIALNLADYAYYPFTLKRTTGTVVSQFSNESNIFMLLFDFLIDYWYLLILFMVLVYGLIKVYDILQLVKPKILNWQFYLVQCFSFLFIIFLFIGGVRGGWAHSTRPITLSNAGDYVKNPDEMSIVLNTPFSILKTLKAVSLQEMNFFSNEELDQLYAVKHMPKDTASFKKLNVVFLILESFGRENIGALNQDIDNGNYKGYTPFLDSLISESFAFKNAYANGRKSIDALPSVITGIPSVGEPFVLSIYSGNKTTSIAKLLGDEGYSTAFFHGAPNGSMGFSAYMKLAGVQNYYGKTEYNNDQDFDGIWGIWDEPFMQYMANTLDTLKQPFFASFFSLSSHHPFKVPEKYKGVFPKGKIPLHEPTGYSDHALKEFFATASKMDWYDNTLFVLCADHASQSYLPEYQTSANTFAIPIIFYYPGGELKGMSNKLIQQMDIMPTVLNYLNFPKPYFAFGFDAFDSKNSNFVINNIGSSFNIYYDNYFLSHDGEKALSLYDLKNDRFQKNDLKDSKLTIMDTMETQLKAFIQRYNHSMIHNELTIQE